MPIFGDNTMVFGRSAKLAARCPYTLAKTPSSIATTCSDGAVQLIGSRVHTLESPRLHELAFGISYGMEGVVGRIYERRCDYGNDSRDFLPGRGFFIIRCCLFGRRTSETSVPLA